MITVSGNRLAQVALRANDLDRAIAFYRDVLEAPFVAKFDPPGLAFFELGGTRLLLEAAAPSSLLYWRVDAIGAACEDLRAKGVTIIEEPRLIFRDEKSHFGAPGTEVWMAAFHDSEGNLVVLDEDRRPSPPDRTLTLTGDRVLLRPLRPDDVDPLERILREPDVAAWWGGYESDPRSVFEEIFAATDVVALTIQVQGEPIGLIQYEEENIPDYRHASIDMFLATRWQGRGLGPEAVRLLARWLFEERGHHRLTIDPAVANERAIRSYERVGFRPVGVMRHYERGPDGVWRDGLLMELLASDLPK